MHLIVPFIIPAMYSGGVVTQWEYANAMAARGHRATLVHIGSGEIDSIDWFKFHPEVEHVHASGLDDPAIPSADVIFNIDPPARLGLPAVFIQGHRMISEEWERPAFVAPCPKVCVAQWLIEVGQNYGSPTEQLIHIPPGLDHDLFKVRTPLDQRPIDIAMLYGQPHPAKGWDVGLAVVERLRELRPDLRVAAFSVPPPSSPLPDWMELHLNPARTFLADEIYNAAKVFIQPSHYEGFGLTALEAMASGCALVTTDNGGSREYAHPDRDALVVPPADPDSMVAAVARLLDDHRLRHRLAETGAETARSFRWEKAGEQLEALLLSYLADPGYYQQPPSGRPDTN